MRSARWPRWLGGQTTRGRGLAAVGAARRAARPALALGVTVLCSGAPFARSTLPDLLPLGGGLAFASIRLGAFFLILIGLGARAGRDLWRRLHRHL